MQTEAEVTRLHDEISSDGTLDPGRAWVVLLALAWMLSNSDMRIHEELLKKRIGRRE